MPSRAYRQWQHVRARDLDQLESAHTLLGGSARGRRYTTQQINRAYAVLLASQFQGFRATCTQKRLTRSWPSLPNLDSV